MNSRNREGDPVFNAESSCQDSKASSCMDAIDHVINCCGEPNEPSASKTKKGLGTIDINAESKEADVASRCVDSFCETIDCCGYDKTASLGIGNNPVSPGTGTDACSAMNRNASNGVGKQNLGEVGITCAESFCDTINCCGIGKDEQASRGTSANTAINLNAVDVSKQDMDGLGMTCVESFCDTINCCGNGKNKQVSPNADKRAAAVNVNIVARGFTSIESFYDCPEDEKAFDEKANSSTETKTVDSQDDLLGVEMSQMKLDKVGFHSSERSIFGRRRLKAFFLLCLFVAVALVAIIYASVHESNVNATSDRGAVVAEAEFGGGESSTRASPEITMSPSMSPSMSPMSPSSPGSVDTGIKTGSTSPSMYPVQAAKKFPTSFPTPYVVEPPVPYTSNDEDDYGGSQCPVGCLAYDCDCNIAMHDCFCHCDCSEGISGKKGAKKSGKKSSKSSKSAGMKGLSKSSKKSDKKGRRSLLDKH